MAKAASSQIVVRAIKKGFDNLQVRNVGDIFTIPDEKAFSDRWMEKVPPKDLKATQEKREEFEERFADDPTVGPDVRRSALDKMGDDLKVDSSDKDLRQRVGEGAEKAREKEEAEAATADAAAAKDDKSKGKK